MVVINVNRCNVLHFVKRFFSVKRKFPLNPEHKNELPVFEYSVSKKKYKRVFSWGNFQTGALGVPWPKDIKSSNNVKEFLWYPKRLHVGENFEVQSAACGFGFTVFAVDSESDIKLHGVGINTDCQIGYHEKRKGHPLETIFIPQPIHLPFKNPTKTKINKVSAGRAHVLVLTDEGLFTLGNNAYGQCGRKIIEDEDYAMSNFIHVIKEVDNKRIVNVECGQDNSLVITEDGSVYACGWGADGQTGLGHFNNTAYFQKVKGDIEHEKIVKIASRADFVLALNDKGQVFGWGNNEYGQLSLEHAEQQVCNPTYIKMLSQIGKVKSIGSSGSFCVVSTEHGEVYSWGYGLLGAGPKVQQSKLPVHLPSTLFGKNDFQPNCMVQKVTCGLNYAAAVTNLGDLYIWGRNKYGCLGLGHEKDQYFPLKVCLGGHVEQIYCGVDHTVAICKPFV